MDVIRINEEDQVVVAPLGLHQGQSVWVGGREILVLDDIPPCHKMAVEKIPAGKRLLKYGCPFGVATQDIRQGQWVHTHNVRTELEGILSYRYEPGLEGAKTGEEQEGSFQGYVRKDGQAGIRNTIFVIPTVQCANASARKVADQANALFPVSECFDGFIALPHPYGCCQTGDDLLNTQKILAGLARNPNAGGTLFMSLGCEVNAPSVFVPILGEVDPEAVKILIMQEVGDEIEEGLDRCREIYDYVTSFRRTPVPFSKLVVGVNCGGSDGLSGITANPLIGEVSNRIIRRGGSVVMTEVPEMFGAEQFLMNRARDEAIFQSIVGMINDYKAYFESHHESAIGNLTQGNQAGGLTTLEEKSLGCIQKGGTAVVTDVLRSGERFRKPGLVLLSSAGNDFIGVTSQIAAGCNLILFTTGRGTPGGFAAPTFRVSSNTSLYERKKHWIDFNAGVLLEGRDLHETALLLYDRIVETINGAYHTRNEVNQYFEIGIFKQGITI
ncbi:MAG TPA: altronate dehydratase family protein [Thermodesulfobacteriota bacterium]|nr:altronate dehydratase family protein [Thermodesulfobacteriota bacterium]